MIRENSRLRGFSGEEIAAEHFRKKRFRILAMGYRSRFGEIDVIAENREYVVFAEVKLRKPGSPVRPGEYVDRRKQDRIRTTAAIWLQQYDTERQPRFVVIEITADPDMRRYTLEHIENAFE